VKTSDYCTKLDEAPEEIKKCLKQIQNKDKIKRIVLAFLPSSLHRVVIKNAIKSNQLGCQCLQSEQFANFIKFAMHNVMLGTRAKVGNSYKICKDLSSKGTYHVAIDMRRQCIGNMWV